MGFAYAITLDGDGQHYPKEISQFLQANREHPWSLIVGSRQSHNGDGPHCENRLEGQPEGSRFANQFSNFWFWVQTGRKLSDTQTGYRLYPLKRLHGLSLLTSRYEAELELLVFASWHGVELGRDPRRRVLSAEGGACESFSSGQGLREDIGTEYGAVFPCRGLRPAAADLAVGDEICQDGVCAAVLKTGGCIS